MKTRNGIQLQHHSNFSKSHIIFPEHLFATVTSDGEVDVSYNEIITLRCLLDVHLFPFDEQRCTIKVLSWAHHSELLHLQPHTVDVSRESYQVGYVTESI